MKKFIHQFILAYFDRATYRCYRNQFYNYLTKLGLKYQHSEGEEAYVAKWSKLSKRIETYSYSLFSIYCGSTPNIIPEDVGHRKVENVLNPVRYRSFYSDKNMYGTYLTSECMPATVLRRVNGGQILDNQYKIVVRGGGKRVSF